MLTRQSVVTRGSYTSYFTAHISHTVDHNLQGISSHQTPLNLPRFSLGGSNQARRKHRSAPLGETMRRRTKMRLKLSRAVYRCRALIALSVSLFFLTFFDNHFNRHNDNYFSRRISYPLGSLRYDGCLKSRRSECVLENTIFFNSELLLLTDSGPLKTFDIDTGYSLGPRRMIKLRQVRRLKLPSSLHNVETPVAMFSLGTPTLYRWYLGLAAGIHALQKHHPSQRSMLFPIDHDAYQTSERNILDYVDKRLLFLVKHDDFRLKPILFQHLVLSFVDDFSRIPEIQRFQTTDHIGEIRKSWRSLQLALGINTISAVPRTGRYKAVLLSRVANSCRNGEVQTLGTCKRLIVNEDEVRQAINKYFDIVSIDQNESPKELQRQLQDVNVLIGVHGQGLGLQMYMHNAIIIEIFPHSFQKQVYHNMAVILGHRYLFWQNTIDDNVRGFWCKSLHVKPDYASMTWKNCFRNTDTVIDINSFQSVLRSATARSKFIIVDAYSSPADLLRDLEMLCALSLQANRTLILPCLHKNEIIDCTFVEKNFNSNILHTSRCHLISVEQVQSMSIEITDELLLPHEEMVNGDFSHRKSFADSFIDFASAHSASLVRVDSSSLLLLRKSYVPMKSRSLILDLDNHTKQAVLERTPCSGRVTSVSAAVMDYSRSWLSLWKIFHKLSFVDDLHVIEGTTYGKNAGESQPQIDQGASETDGFVSDAVIAVYCAHDFMGCENLALSQYIAYWRAQKGKPSSLYVC